MERKIKEIYIYISDDGMEFYTEKECVEYEKHCKLNSLHKKLIECKFYNILRNKFRYTNLDFDNSFFYKSLRYGCMNYKIRYKYHGTKIVLLLYDTLSSFSIYIGSIPKYWIDIESIDELQKEVDLFIKDKKYTYYER